MRKIFAVIAISITFGGAPIISFAKAGGCGWMGEICPNGTVCQGSNIADGSTCVPISATNGGNNNPPPPPVVPELPVWWHYNPFTSWLASWVTPQAPIATPPPIPPAARPVPIPTALNLVTPPRQTTPCRRGNIGGTPSGLVSSGGLATAGSCAMRLCQQWKNPSPQYTYQECLKDVPDNIVAIQDAFHDAVTTILNSNPQYRSRTYTLNLLQNPTETTPVRNGIADTARTCASIKAKPTVTWISSNGSVTTATQTRALAECDTLLQDPVFLQIFNEAQRLDNAIAADITKRKDAVKKCEDDFNATGQNLDFSNPNCLETPPACVGP